MGAALLAAAISLSSAPPRHSQEQVAAIDFQMPDLTKLSGSKRSRTIRQLALTIRAIPANPDAVKVVLATELAQAATDDGSDHDTLQEATTTLSEALRECPMRFDGPYGELASLIRYENMRASLDDPRMAAAMAKLEAEDREIQQIDFTLADLQGKSWTLKGQRGKVVLVNFWAAWCLPCVNEIPTLNALYRRFEKKDLVILAIADNDAPTMQRFLAERPVLYPVLLDSGRKISDGFHAGNIPRSLVYDRAGTLVAQVIGGRTLKQFVETLGRAGLH
jgi:peroxiredoxin